MAQATIDTTVAGLQGVPISPQAPTNGQALMFNGTVWIPTNPPAGLPLSGGTLTGPLVLSGNATTALNPVTLQQLQANYLLLTGGNISGSLNVAGNAGFAGNVTITGGNGQPLWLQNGAINYNFQVTASNANPASSFYIQSTQFSGGWAFSLIPNNGGFPTAQFNVNTVWIGGDASPALVIQNLGGGVNWGVFNAGNALAIMPATGVGQPSGVTRYVYCNANIGWLQTGVSFGPENDNSAYCGGGGGGSWTGVGSYAFNQASDPRNKSDMTPAPVGALDKVKALNVITYHTTPPANRVKSDQLRTGFDAAEVYKVHPDAVTLDDDKNAVAYSLSDMNALLWQAVQELAAQVASLQGAK